MTQENFALNSAFARPEFRIAEANARMGGRMGFDYDYSKDDPMARLLDPRGHGSDKGKLPWHPTFSTQSDYSTAKNPGGVWGYDVFGNTFTPAANQRGPSFNEYMKYREPDVRVIR